ncbi:MAG: hypothetical protein M4579_006577 [Chaenotheca gracillima]|nr:MAG: hypothetical protein M4579_006577 [Chaenotheca gracillima]
MASGTDVTNKRPKQTPPISRASSSSISPTARPPNSDPSASTSTSAMPRQHHQLPPKVARDPIRGRGYPKDDRSESSPDESTAIVWRERGSGRRNYGVSISDNGRQSRDTSDHRRPRHSDETQVDPDADERHGRHEQDDNETSTQNSGPEPQDQWWRRVADKYGSIELENKASVARDHLALERTFLAWLRTSLAFASIGIAVTQLFRLNTTITQRDPGAIGANHLRHVGKPLGATFLGIAMLVLFVGFHRYFESQHWIIRGKFPASRGSVFVISLVAALLIIVSLVVVVTVDTNAYER